MSIAGDNRLIICSENRHLQRPLIGIALMDRCYLARSSDSTRDNVNEILNDSGSTQSCRWTREYGCYHLTYFIYSSHISDSRDSRPATRSIDTRLLLHHPFLLPVLPEKPRERASFRNALLQVKLRENDTCHADRATRTRRSFQPFRVFLRSKPRARTRCRGTSRFRGRYRSEETPNGGGEG